MHGEAEEACSSRAVPATLPPKAVAQPISKSWNSTVCSIRLTELTWDCPSVSPMVWSRNQHESGTTGSADAITLFLEGELA